MKTGIVIAALLSSLGVMGCHGNGVSDARARAVSFHAQYNASDWAGIYASAGPSLRASASPEKLATLLDKVHDSLGAYKESTQIGFRYNLTNNGTVVTTQYMTTFEKGVGTETFTFSTGKQLALEGYHVDSPRLLAAR